jgi:hypothetical protein
MLIDFHHLLNSSTHKNRLDFLHFTISSKVQPLIKRTLSTYLKVAGLLLGQK